MIATLAAALEQRGYAQLTPVQEAVTDPDLGQADLLVSAQTGSGKTVGFGLAIAPTLLGDDTTFGPAGAPLALIVAPTRELALQVKRELAWLYAQAGAIIASTVGGMDMRDEKRTLERGAHIVVATPGRLRDHIMRNSLDMTAIRAIVLDEADEMLDLGFREDLEFILGSAPETRRTLMFSATVPNSIAKLAQSYQKNAVRVTTVAERSQHADIAYRALNVAPQDAENAIINVLRFYEAQNALVFANTRAMVTRLTTRLSNRGFQVVALSGELSQTERSHALQAMRDGRARVCVATDVAARGIDLPNLELVIHAELPSNSEVLLHRSGRTGRAGNKGVSTFIVPPKVRRKAEMLLKGAKVTAEWAAPPSADEVNAKDRERLLSDPVWHETPTDAEMSFAAQLLELHDPVTIAAAYLRLYAGRIGAPEDLAAGDTSAPAPRKEFGPSRWFRVNVGRDDRVEARWLMPLLCNSGGITRDDVGAIRIQQSETFFEISDGRAAGFLTALGQKMTLEGGQQVTGLDAPPDLAPRYAPKTHRKGDDDTPRPDRAPRPARAPREFAPRDVTPPPASAAPDEPAILAQPAPVIADEDRKPRKPRAARPEPRDHGDALTAYKPKAVWDRPKPDAAASDRPAYKGKSDAAKGDRPAYKGKSDRPTDGKPAYKPKSEGFKSFGKPSDGAVKGKSEGYKSVKEGAKPFKVKSDKPFAKTDRPVKPKANPADTSKRFVPPGAKVAPRTPSGKPASKGGGASPRRPAGPKGR